MGIFGIASTYSARLVQPLLRIHTSNKLSRLSAARAGCQSGNLSQAKGFRVASATSSRRTTKLSAPLFQCESSNPGLPPFHKLAQDLIGNLTAAQSDFATGQQNLQQAGPQAGAPRPPPSHHTRAMAISGQSSGQTEYQSPRSFSANWDRIHLQSGNLSAAQQDFSSSQQDSAIRAQQFFRHMRWRLPPASGANSASR